MRYTSRGLRRSRGTDKWDVTLSHRDPLSGELVSTYHTVEAKTRKKAEKARDELILELERRGNAYNSKLTLAEFLDKFIAYKEGGMQVERSTVEHYRKQAKVINRYLGTYRLSEVTIPVVSGWMAQMVEEGYAPRSVAKPFGLLRQAMNHAIALDLVFKNPCDYCRPPKIKRKKLDIAVTSEELLAEAEAMAKRQDTTVDELKHFLGDDLALLERDVREDKIRDWACKQTL